MRTPAIIAVQFLLSLTLGLARADDSPLQLRIHTDSDLYHLGDTVTVRISLENTGDRPIALYETYPPLWTTQLHLEYKDGPPGAPQLPAVFDTPVELVVLRPAETLEYTARGTIAIETRPIPGDWLGTLGLASGLWLRFPYHEPMFCDHRYGKYELFATLSSSGSATQPQKEVHPQTIWSGRVISNTVIFTLSHEQPATSSDK